MPRKNAVSWHQPKGVPGRWRFSKTDTTGKRRYYYASPEIPHTDAGRRKANAWMEGVLNDLTDRIVTDGDWNLDELTLAYLGWCKQEVGKDERSHHTLDGHRKHLNLICAMPRSGHAYGNVLVRELTAKVVGELVKTWEKAGRGSTTIRNRIGSLQACLNWAAQPRDDRPIERLIPANPIAGYELPKAVYQGDRYAPADEVDAWLAWLDQRAAAATGKLARFERLTALLIQVAAETGCRPGELCVLQWEHFDHGRGVIVLPPKKHKTGRKTGKPRLILMSKDLARRLESLRADPDRHPTHLFTHECGHRIERTDEQRRQGDPWNSNSLSRRVKELRRLAIAAKVLTEDEGLKRMHLYRLRHTKITNSLQRGANPMDVASLSGNSVKVIESTYLHHQIDHLREVVDRLASEDQD